jgi:hypothetical protein
MLDMTKETTIDEFLMHVACIKMITVLEHGLGQCAQGMVGMARLITSNALVSDSRSITATQDDVCIDWVQQHTQCSPTFGGSYSQMAAVPQLPLVVPAPPAPVPDLQAVFAVCGITAEVTCTHVIMNDGFTSPEDLSVLESNTEVTEMVKHLASCNAADGHADLRTVQIKKIQALVWWVCDEIKHGQALTTADWDAPAVNMAMECKCINKEYELADVGVKDQSNLI